MESTAEIIHPENPRWSVFAESRAAGHTMAASYRQAFPRSKFSDGCVRKRAFDLEKREPVAALIGDLRAKAMTQAVECGASLILRCKQEIDAATTTDTPQAVFERLEELGEAATAAGDLQAAVNVMALRVKMIEVLGRIRLQATSILLKYTARVNKGNGSVDAPVKVEINYSQPEPPHGGFPLPNPSRS